MRSALKFAVVLLAVILAGGCGTFESRVKQKADVFAALPPETRERLKNAIIRLGDTEDMVFVAMGKPDERKTVETAEGVAVIWIYNRCRQEYRGDAGGFVRRTVVDPKTGATNFYLEPVFRPVYDTAVQPVLQVTFAAGKVSMIERPLEK